MNYLKLEILAVVLLTLIIIGLVLSKKLIKNEKIAYLIFRIFAISTSLIHYSSLFINLIETGYTRLYDNYVLAPYPCNVVMWICFVLVFFENRDSVMFKLLSEFVAIGGTVCGIFGIILNPDFLVSPSVCTWWSFKAVLSHATMVFSTLFLLVMGYVKISALRNTVSNLFGCFLLALSGLHTRLIDIMYSQAYENTEFVYGKAMYLFESPVEGMPWATFPVIVLIGTIVLFASLNIYEFFAYKKEKRWYNQKRLGLNYLKTY